MSGTFLFTFTFPLLNCKDNLPGAQVEPISTILPDLRCRRTPLQAQNHRLMDLGHARVVLSAQVLDGLFALLSCNNGFASAPLRAFACLHKALALDGAEALANASAVAFRPVANVRALEGEPVVIRVLERRVQGASLALIELDALHAHALRIVALPEYVRRCSITLPDVVVVNRVHQDKRTVLPARGANPFNGVLDYHAR